MAKKLRKGILVVCLGLIALAHSAHFQMPTNTHQDAVALLQTAGPKPGFGG